MRGGNFYGRWPTLAVNGPDDSGNQGRFIPSTEIPAIFPNVGRFASADLGFMV